MTSRYGPQAERTTNGAWKQRFLAGNEDGSVAAVKRMLDGCQERFRRLLLCLEPSGGVLALRTDRLQESQVGVHHVSPDLVTRTGVLILALCEELVRKDTGLVRARDLASRRRLRYWISHGHPRNDGPREHPGAYSRSASTEHGRLHSSLEPEARPCPAQAGALRADCTSNATPRKNQGRN